MEKSFSLIELLISLIILSLLIAAFTPLITKKIKATDVAVGSFRNITRDITEEDCAALNAVYVPKAEGFTKPLCVMKYNVGDGYYNENWAGVQNCIAGQDCTVEKGGNVSNTRDNLQPTCWSGTTASSTCDSNAGGYSGCNRTVCNWTGANRLCENMGWRLPTFKEETAFANYTYTNSTLGSDGLMLCSHNTVKNAPACMHLSGMCIMGYNNACQPYSIWSSTGGNYPQTWGQRNSGWFYGPAPLNLPMSARCVLDSIIDGVTIATAAANAGAVTECKEGYHSIGSKCYTDIPNCSQYNNYNQCMACEEGYTLYNNQCGEGSETSCYDYFCAVCTSTSKGACTLCKEGYTLYNGKCYFGTLEGCSGPAYDDTYQVVTCSSCQEGYTKCDSGSCRSTSALNEICPGNTIKIGCICVAQYNIGDGYYGENLLAAVQKCTAGEDCTVENGKNTSATARNLQAACWKGTTSSSVCNANYGGYSGCTRTLCNWTGGAKMCESIGWRMPTMPELEIFADDAATYSNPTLGADGLMLCGPKSTVPVCANLAGGCAGSYENKCSPHAYFSSTFVSIERAYVRNMNDDGVNWNNYDMLLSAPHAVRCVKDL